MQYALVLLPLEKNTKEVLETCFITDFDKYEGHPTSHIYHYDDGEIQRKGLILLVSDSPEELINPTTRLRIPTYNKSSLESDSSSGDDETEVKKAKAARTQKKQNSANTRKRKSKEIVEAFKSKSKIQNTKVNNQGRTQLLSTVNQNAGGSSMGDITKVSTAASTTEGETSTSTDVKTWRMQQMLEKKRKHLEQEQQKLAMQLEEERERELREFERQQDIARQQEEDQEREWQEDANRLEEERERQQEDIARQLEEEREREQQDIARQQEEDQERERRENAKRLEEEREREQQDIARQQEEDQERERREQEQQEYQRRREQIRAAQQNRLLRAQRQQPQQGNNDNAYYMQNDQFKLGDNIFISSSAYREASTQDTPAAFISRMANAIWPRDVLASKVVRKQKNTGHREAFTPRKVELISYHFENFLLKRNYDVTRQQIELKNINMYLGRAITTAKRQLVL